MGINVFILEHELIVEISSIPLCKMSQSISQTCIGLKAEVLFQGGCVCIGYRDIARLHGNKFLVGFKVIVFGKYSCTNQFFLEDGYEVKEVFGRVVTDVVYLIWRYWQSIFTILLLWCVLHDADYTFYYVVYKSKVALAVAIVEDFNGFAFNKFVGETEVCHVGTTSWTIDGEETEASRWDVIEFAISMSHQLVALLGSGIKRYRVVNLVVS